MAYDRDYGGGSRRDYGGYQSGREGYRDRNDRDWTDRAGDEVRSWFGDEDAERRRRMDDRRDWSAGQSYGVQGYRGQGYGSPDYEGYGRQGYGGGYRGGYGRDYGDQGSGDRDRFSGQSGSYGSWRSSDYGPSYSGAGGFGTDYSGYGRGDTREGYRSTGRSDYGGGYGGYGRDRDRDRGDRGFLDRAGDEVASWFGDDDAERRRRRDASHSGRGPKGYKRSDDRIREDVSDRLSDDPHIDASDIEVTVQGAEVTLSGTVQRRFDKRHAEDIAERISGVSHVQNNLRVSSQGSSPQGSSTGFGASGADTTAGTAGTMGAAVGSRGTRSGTSRQRTDV